MIAVDQGHHRRSEQDVAQQSNNDRQSGDQAEGNQVVHCGDGENEKSTGKHDGREQQCPAGGSQGLLHCQPHISMDQVITPEVMHEMNGIINSQADCDAAHQNRHRVQRQSQHSHHPQPHQNRQKIRDHAPKP